MPSRASSGSEAARWVIGFVAVDDAKAQVDEFAHGGGDGDELGLAASQQALVEFAHVAVVLLGHDGGHMQRRGINYGQPD